jgi:GTP diphosphokinase / guanosine-3',5'-bis(diphosphate) 3'-diphosphatase
MTIDTDRTAPAPAGRGAPGCATVCNNGDLMNEILILKAANVAADWHSRQRRKGASAEPYVNHLLEVAALVAEADPGNTDLVIAALLHDSIEDVKKNRADIAEIFGEHVAALVLEVTDDKALPKPERKRLQVETAAQKSRSAKLLKLADKTSNLRSVAISPPAHWSDERRREYVAWAERVAGGVRGVSAWLDQQFDEAKALALRSIPEAIS